MLTITQKTPKRNRKRFSLKRRVSLGEQITCLPDGGVASKAKATCSRTSTGTTVPGHFSFIPAQYPSKSKNRKAHRSINGICANFFRKLPPAKKKFLPLSVPPRPFIPMKGKFPLPFAVVRGTGKNISTKPATALRIFQSNDRHAITDTFCVRVTSTLIIHTPRGGRGNLRYAYVHVLLPISVFRGRTTK
ncbi:unnamed protein product [Amoebophrya sp. A120]|nr:unnamed protein product [Amoebophrya sp. A120]|eukprot:GSA120T00003610001.1